MTIRHVHSASAAAVLMFVMAAFAETTGQTPPPTRASSDTETQITLVGCLQREADYRREHASGRGGGLGTGAGLKNEYILVNASMAPARMGSAAGNPCAASGSGDAYELTGKRERELERFVGRSVHITGMLKPADTSGTTGRPTGGFDPMGQDLKLHEVNVASFREVAEGRSPAAGTQATQPVRPEEPAPRPATQEDLPRTAGTLPLTGLIGLLALGGALGIRSLRRQ